MKKTKVKPRRGIKIFAIFVIVLVIVFLYARYINTSGLVVNEIAVYNEKLSADYNGLKIAHFSDVHYGRTINESYLDKLVNELNELNADIVIFTGDLFDNSDIDDKSKNIVTDALKKINAKLFKFAVIGDYDKKYLDIYKEILTDSNFTLLDNENKLVYYNSNEALNFIGITNISSDINELYKDNFNITIMHEPDNIKDLNTNIAFAGHSLGGQIKIPFVGGLIKQNGAKTYIDSYYKVDDQLLYISNGLGTQKFSLRMFNKPSISLYRLYKK